MAAKEPYEKDPLRQWLGKRAKEMGKQFEDRLDKTFAYYDERGYAIVEKTPEPMRPTKSLGNGKFIAYFEKKAQPDYKGTLKGGRALVLEAKFTSTDRMEWDRVLPGQRDYMEKHSRLGARCYVVIGFISGEVYRLPWEVWRAMKEVFGHKYVTEADVQKYRVSTAWNDTLYLL